MSDYQGNIIRKNPATPTGPSTYGSASGMWSLNEVAYWIKQGVWPNPAIVPDIYFPYVSLLLSTTSLGNANNNLFVDSSGAFNPVSRNGNTTQGSFTPYATNWSNYFDASGDYERISSSQTALQFGTGDFTVEGWVYSTGATGTFQQILTGGTSWTSGSGGVYWYYNGGSPYIGAAWNQIATNPAVNSGTLAINTWHHFAVVRSGNTLILYVNGTSVDTLDVTGVSIAVNNQSQTNIGGGGWDQDFGGYLSNLRVVKGTAVYTANFTVPTSPLTAISGTSLLTCQSNRFRDASTNNFTITVAGNTSVTDFGPFSPSTYAPIAYNQSDITNWSGYFDGSGDYVETITTSAFTLSSGDWTVQGWYYSAPYTAANQVLCSIGVSGDNLVVATIGSNGYLYYLLNNVVVISTTTAAPAGTWAYFALVKSGSTTTLYLNGVSIGTTTSVPNATSKKLRLGVAYDGTSPLNGYISNFRILSGTADTAVPTAPFTAIANTAILTCQNAAFTDNSTNNFVITPYGNATVTGNSPFNTVGYWSNYFNGSSYLAAANNAAIQLGTGAFTIEGWFNIPSYAANQPLFDQRASGPSSNAFVIYVKTTGTLAFYSYSPGIDVTFNTVISTNAWNHFAFVRSGNTGTMYVNGVAQSTTIDLSAYNNTSSANRIMQSFDPSYATGYLSNFRIVKGTAVYTANFTPPTAPLTAISGTGLLTCQSSRFIDSSSNALTITVNGSPSVQSFDPFYTATIASNGGSMYFDGTGDYLQVPTNASLQFGTSDFTVEFWMNLIARDSSGTAVFNNYNSFTTGALGFFAGHASASSTVYQVAVNGTFPAISSTQTIVYNSWNHFAIVRNGNTLTLYINGVANGTFSMSGITINGVGSNWWLGSAQDAPSNYELNGYLANFRVSKFAVYTAAFTPPTAPLTPSANTTLLVNGMNAGIYDATTINDMETVGNAQVTTAVSKFGGSSVYFDGSGDALQIPFNAALDLTSGNFTIEGWVYFNAVSGTPTIITPFGTGTDYGGWVIALDGSSRFTYYLSTSANTWNVASNVLFSASAAVTGTWYHFALVRNGSTFTPYLNGVAGSTTTSSATLYNNNKPYKIGAEKDSNSFPLNGYVDDVRITKGVARYTSNFTPPTQAFPVY